MQLDLQATYKMLQIVPVGLRVVIVFINDLKLAPLFFRSRTTTGHHIWRSRNPRAFPTASAEWQMSPQSLETANRHHHVS